MARDSLSGTSRKLKTRGVVRIVFISSSEKDRFRPILTALRGSGVLTVGDTAGFAEMGGVINFILVDNRVHIEINLDAAKVQRLKISSRLLRLAQIVRNGNAAGRTKMFSIRNLSIKSKLRLMIMVTVGAALALAIVALIGYDYVAFRQA